jgi:hypothetical protein
MGAHMQACAASIENGEGVLGVGVVLGGRGVAKRH